MRREGNIEIMVLLLPFLVSTGGGDAGFDCTGGGWLLGSGFASSIEF